MSEHGNDLTHILLAYAEILTRESSFSERVEAMTNARTQIESLYATKETT